MTGIETRDSVGTGPSGKARYWHMELASANKAEKDYRKEAGEILKRYSGEECVDLNILWSNVETLKPVVYSNTAKPDVRRRYKTQDPTAKGVAVLTERAVEYTCDRYEFDSAMYNIRDEMLLTGRGVGWVEYALVESEVMQEQQSFDPETGFPVINQVPVTVIADQKCTVLYLNYEDFRMSPAKCWEDVRWVARRHLPTREELIEKFPQKGEQIKLSHSLLEPSDNDDRNYSPDGDDVFLRAEVWEIWDKEQRKRIWYAPIEKNILEEEDDPYELENFFPCPKPVYSYQIPGTLVPKAEYMIYRKQVEILNKLSRKLDDVSEQIKLAGFYNAVNEAAGQILTAKNGQFIPITTVTMDTSAREMVQFWPIENVARAMAALIQARDDQIKLIHQVTGISDIVRGSTAASETATAQQLKGNFANMRMQPRQRPFQEFVRGLFRIKSELIVEKFSPEMLQEMTQIQITPEMLQLMKSDKLRSYRIDIETDSTVQPDADADKNRRIEFLTAFSQTIERLAPLVQAGVMPMETAKEMLMFTMQGFKVGRNVEEAFEKLGDGQQQQQNKPDPEIMKLQAETQKEMAKLQANQQIKMAEMQQKGQLKQAEIATDAQLEREEMAMNAQLKQREQNIKAMVGQ